MCIFCLMYTFLSSNFAAISNTSPWSSWDRSRGGDWRPRARPSLYTAEQVWLGTTGHPGTRGNWDLCATFVLSDACWQFNKIHTNYISTQTPSDVPFSLWVVFVILGKPVSGVCVLNLIHQIFFHFTIYLLRMIYDNNTAFKDLRHKS